MLKPTWRKIFACKIDLSAGLLAGKPLLRTAGRFVVESLPVRELVPSSANFVSEVFSSLLQMKVGCIFDLIGAIVFESI